MISLPMVRSAQTVHLSCVKVSTISKRTENELPLEPRHLVVPSRAPKTISEPIVRVAQTTHLSCTDLTLSPNGKEARFQMTHVTLEFHQVCPKRFPSLWYVRRKPCTYLASRLGLSPNGRNELPLKHRHLVAPSGASKTISEPVVCLARTMNLSCTDTNTVFKQKEERFQMTNVT